MYIRAGCVSLTFITLIIVSKFENLISSAKRRMLINGESNTTIRMTDFNAVISAINGKIELVYEGEQEGATEISRLLILESVRTFFVNYFPKIKKLNKLFNI